MGHVMNGKWVDDDRITADVRGAFVRADSQFRRWVTADGSAGPLAALVSEVEPGRVICNAPTTCALRASA